MANTALTLQTSTEELKAYFEALRQLADEVEAKEKAQLLLAEKTEQLDESKEWYSIKRWAQIHRRNWRSYNWRKCQMHANSKRCHTNSATLSRRFLMRIIPRSTSITGRYLKQFMGNNCVVYFP